MKKLLCLMLCIILLSGCAATYDGPTVEKSVLASIQTTYYGTDGDASQYGLTEYSYDIYGNQVIELEYHIRSHGENAEFYLKTIRTFDEKGSCTRQRQYDVSGLFPRKLVDIRYEFDEKGRMVSHQDKLDPQFSWTAIYDDEARTMTCTYPHAVSVSFFDEHGWTVRQETTFEDGETSAIISEFRSDGQRVSTQYVENGGVTLHSYTYDDQGRVLTKSATTDGATRELIRYEYGENYMIQYNADGTKIVTSYHDDGSLHHIYHTDSHERITTDEIYSYIAIQVPTEEVTP